jgi:CRP/FNR family transcriptional regulator, cyclic AMP receptor protein
MFNRVAGRFVWVVVGVMFGYLACNAFAADGTRGLTLSGALAQATLFKGLTDAERDALQAAATLRRGQVGERIIQQGKAMGRMFIILEGQAEVRVNGELIVTLSGQTLVGEIEYLDGLPASADVILLKETDLIELNYAALTGLIEEQPRMGYVIIREIARIEAKRLRNSNSK